MEKRMPAVFVGHGSPMLALEHNEVTQGLADMGKRIIEEFGMPKAMLAVSAHWFTVGTRVQTTEKPEQVNDMYGFPEELYELTYPVDGCPELGHAVLDIEGIDAIEDNSWGIDHGVWTPLYHMFPKANIPIVELSVNRQLTARQSYEIGTRLARLRDQGYIVLGSGNVVHNLRAAQWNNPTGISEAVAFNDAIRQAVEARDDEVVIDYEQLPNAAYAVPTPDHFLPLLYILGASQGEKPVVFNNVCNLGSMAMTGFVFGM